MYVSDNLKARMPADGEVAAKKKPRLFGVTVVDRKE
jgi:hypothetical protein